MEAVVTFHTTHGVITGERLLLAAGLPVEAAGLPPAVSAGCGLCLRLPQSELAPALAVLAAQGADVQDVYIRRDADYQIISEWRTEVC